MEDKLNNIKEYFDSRIEELKDLRAKADSLHTFCNHYIDRDYFKKWLTEVGLEEQQFLDYLRNMVLQIENVLRRVVIRDEEISIEKRLGVYNYFTNILNELPERFYGTTCELLEDLEKYFYNDAQ